MENLAIRAARMQAGGEEDRIPGVITVSKVALPPGKAGALQAGAIAALQDGVIEAGGSKAIGD